MALDSWRLLLSDNLPTDFVTGKVLLSRTGQCLYCEGLPANQEWTQFEEIFDQNAQILTLKTKPSDSNTKFVIFRKSESNLYAISEGTREGLIACSLPWGLLVCTAVGSPAAMNKAIPAVEKLTSKLRH